jgi:predicted transcriptional regulator
MAKDAVFTMKLEPELRDAFVAAAEAADRPASQIVREMMRDFVAKDRERQEYNEFYRRKVEKARKSFEAGRFHTSEEVEALMEARLAELSRGQRGKRT